MSENNYLGKDGKYYSDWSSLINANIVYDNNMKQTELLAKQEKAIQEQNRLLRLQIEENRMAEVTSQKHEEQMRITRLCDEIGISKKLLDRFLNFIVSDNCYENEEILKLKSELDMITRRYIDLNTKKDNITREHNTMIKLKKSSFVMYTWLAVTIICVKLNITFNGIIPSILLMGAGLSLFWAPITTGLYIFEKIKLKKVYIYEHIKNVENLYQQKNEKEIELKNLKKEVEEKLNGIKKQKINDFLIFRRSHYNSRFETLLIESEIDELGMVKKTEIIQEGEIEDYNEYFKENFEK
jgi:hypothetical protein